MTEQTVRASELAEFVFCRLAWWHRLQGIASQNDEAQSRGHAWHEAQARRTVNAGRLAAAGKTLTVAGLLFLVAYSIVLLVR